MNKFNKIYESIVNEEHPIFKPASKEEIKKRQDTKWERWLEDKVAEGEFTKNSDGSYDAKGDVDLSGMNLTKIPVQFNKVGGWFVCNANNLTSLKGSPKEVKEYYWCAYNKLSSLEGAPKKVGGGFNCSENKLSSLKGAPKKVGGYFDCGGNNLTSLEDVPKIVKRYFDCGGNNLTSLKGAPKEVGSFLCSKQNNGHKFTKEDVNKVCNVKGDIYV